LNLFDRGTLTIDGVSTTGAIRGALHFDIEPFVITPSPTPPSPGTSPQGGGERSLHGQRSDVCGRSERGGVWQWDVHVHGQRALVRTVRTV
jgi:hypothetical protein